jgi:hypothetical protein
MEPLPIVVFMMGATNAGKSTALQALSEMGWGDIGLVEVGKLLRAKYGEAYFKGQAAPSHTQTEAWQLLIDGIQEHARNNVKFVVCDGQPRSFDQVYNSLKLPNERIYINLYAPADVREARARARDSANPEKLALSLARLHGDIPMLYEINSILMAAKQEVWAYRTDEDLYNPLQIYSDLLDYRYDHISPDVFHTEADYSQFSQG